MLQMTWELDIEDYKKRGQRVDFAETKYPELIYPDGLFRIILNGKMFFEQPFAILELMRALDTWNRSKAMQYNSIETEDNPLISIVPVPDGWRLQSPWQLFESSDIFSTADIEQAITKLSVNVKEQLESINQEVEDLVVINNPIRQKLSIAERLIAKPWILTLAPFIYLLISLVLPLFIPADSIMVLFILLAANHIGVGVLMAAKIMAFYHQVAMKHSAFKELWMTMGQVKKFLRSKNDDALLERAEVLISFMNWILIGFALSIICLIVAVVVTLS